MSSNAREQFSELVALTEIYLLQEYSCKDWIYSDSDCFKFFKTLEERRREESKNQESRHQASMSKEKPKSAQPSLEKVPQKEVAPSPPKPVVKPVAILVSPPQPIKTESIKTASEPVAAPVATKEEKKEAPKETQVVPKSVFVPEPLSKPKEVDLADMRAAVASAMPQVKIAETPKAPPLASQPSAVLLALGETGEELLFLHNVASAIDRLLRSAEVVSMPKKERDAAWKALLSRPGLTWIIAFGEEVYSLPGISKGQQKIGQVSLLLQPSALSILRDPKQKAALWTLLKQLLK
ncbi:MAG: hypothetical protein LLG04_14605 [Parachlamydia sp.]|nr:hypothetical protein [Parachlamydia sp.]